VLQGFGADAFALSDQTEQDVLGADVGVLQEAGFLLCEDENSSGSVSESLEDVGDCTVWATEPEDSWPRS
jgi:hypothetical protein